MYPNRKNYGKPQGNFKRTEKPADKHQAIYGIHAVTEAINAGKELNKIIFQRGETGPLLQSLTKLARELNIPTQYVPKESSLFPSNKNHQGVLAFVSPVTYHKL
ncbi:MAG: RNA methyltransferase substrate-binding domain-containing protein, partial [Bacteroidia bacterium]